MITERQQQIITRKHPTSRDLKVTLSPVTFFHTNIYAYLCKKETEQLCDPTTEHIYLDPKIWQLILKWYNMMGSYPINYIYKHYCSLW